MYKSTKQRSDKKFITFLERNSLLFIESALVKYRLLQLLVQLAWSFMVQAAIAVITIYKSR
jgi:hypothetical protein